jgi:hypothetical protein
MDADIELVSEFTCFVIEMIINYYLFTSKANGMERFKDSPEVENSHSGILFIPIGAPRTRVI